MPFSKEQTDDRIFLQVKRLSRLGERKIAAVLVHTDVIVIKSNVFLEIYHTFEEI